MSDKFINSCIDTFTNDTTFNKSITENGAVGYKTTMKPLVDLNFKVSSFRDKRYDENKIRDEFLESYVQDPLLALTWLFFVRDIREGLGERKVFRACVSYIVQYIETNKLEDRLNDVFNLFLEYGRCDDLYSFVGTKYEKEMFNFMKTTLLNDLEAFKNHTPNSLMFKWIKSEHCSNKESKALAKKTMKAFGMNSKDYRKFVSEGRKQLDIVETKMCAKDWTSISYDKVPSRASLNYRNAFLRNDNERYTQYQASLVKGETKINVATLYPYDIVHKYTDGCQHLFKNEDITVEESWKTLVNKYKEGLLKDFEDTLVVADGSGSMTSNVGNTKISALDVANSLAILFSQCNKGGYKNLYITFSSNPKFVYLGKEDVSLREKLKIAHRYNEVASTNIEGVFDLILNSAISNNLKQEDMPKNILIISDMEFNQATSGWGYRDFDTPTKALFDGIKERFEANGYKLPRLVFWNTCSRTNTIPIQQNDLGVALVSGFSPNIATMIMSNKANPSDVLLDALNQERYDKIREVFKIN